MTCRGFSGPAAAVVLLGASALLGAGVRAGQEVSQTVRGGGVAVTLSLLPPVGDGLRVRIEMTTHARDLDEYRFADLVRRRDATGKEIGPLAVERVIGGGHHRVAVLRFAAPEPQAAAVEFLVRDVAGVAERRFRWDLRGSAPAKAGPAAPDPTRP